MKKITGMSLLLVLSITFAFAQTKAALDPVITPSVFHYNTPITVTYDVTGTALASLATSAYIWVWIPANSASVAKYNSDPETSGQSNAKFTKSVSGGKTTYSITFTPSDFFTTSIENEVSMGMLLKGTKFTDGQTTDHVAPFGFQIKLVTPSSLPVFGASGNNIAIKALAPAAADFTLTVDNNVVDSKTGITDYTYSLPVNGAQPSTDVIITASSGGQISSVSFTYYLSQASPLAQRPSGIIDGINYSGDATKATLSLWAPQKTSVYLLGDFNDWKIDPDYLMNKDGEHFWFELTGLNAGAEYGFQYLVDQAVYVADPYADKILDPLDKYIASSTYPNLKLYPDGALHANDYSNRVAVLQTNQIPYTWKTTNWQRPAKEKLVIYELIVRDFFASPNNNYQTLIDTIGYFKRLGINAIELMPVTEFSGNDSWGYNPTFMFAPDKAYGTKDKLKEFIDLCHTSGIAVILDVVMNHQELPNPYVAMYFNYDPSVFKPLPANPWFNVNATHPYSVFYDLNHESSYTKKYLDTVSYHWLNDYRFDGLRFDLAKGFTQTVNTDVTAWGHYDASRVAILERMADVIWSKTPDAYVILEHFADNSEETVLANYHAEEGKGMMLWENFNTAYSQNAEGYSDNSDFSAVYFANKGWSKPREVSYMESHDEERVIVNALQYGNSSADYSIKNLNTSLGRMKSLATVFYTIPGAKMLWEFGELGYDKSINTCSDGTIKDECRTYDKPVLWSYYGETLRRNIHDHIATLLRLRRSFDVFTEGTATFGGGNALIKQITLKNNPFTATPSDSTQMNVQVAANFDVTSQMVPVSFSHTGTWYDYYHSNKTITVSGLTESIRIDAGAFFLYTDVPVTGPNPEVITGIEELSGEAISVYPNPSSDVLHLNSATPASSFTLRTMQGYEVSPPKLSSDTWDMRGLAAGMYVVQVRAGEKNYQLKVVKR